MTLFLVVWAFFEKFIVFVVLHDSVSTVGAVTGSWDLLHIVMMRIFRCHCGGISVDPIKPRQTKFRVSFLKPLGTLGTVPDADSMANL